MCHHFLVLQTELYYEYNHAFPWIMPFNSAIDAMTAIDAIMWGALPSLEKIKPDREDRVGKRCTRYPDPGSYKLIWPPCYS